MTDIPAIGPFGNFHQARASWLRHVKPSIVQARSGPGALWRPGRHRARSAARPVSRARALADLPRSHPEQRPGLVHDPQLRLQRRDRNLHFHLRLHGGLRLRRRHGAAWLHRRRRAHSQAVLADLCRPRVPVRDLHGRDLVCRVELRESALRRGDERARLPQAAGGHHHPGDAAQVQARQHGRAAALHRAAAVVPARALAADPQCHRRARAVGRCSMR